MRLQDLKHQELHVEIDRCTKCGGIWLDHGEAEKLLSIGTHMVGQVIEEQRKAQAELDKMEVDLAPAGLIASFLSLFK
jgi:Zn-finger nucleic acid-binding protein